MTNHLGTWMVILRESLLPTTFFPSTSLEFEKLLRESESNFAQTNVTFVFGNS